MKILFRKSTASMLMRLVCYITGGNYGHVEIAFSDGMCFSAIPLYGVKMRRIQNLKDYTIIDVSVTKKQEEKTRKHCRNICGKKYDYIGVLGFLFNQDTFNNSRWYCSRLCAVILHQLGKCHYDGYGRISPSDLFAILNP